jgi:hypothetical protein
MLLLCCAGLFSSVAGDLHVKKEVPARAEWNPALLTENKKTKRVFTRAGDAGRIIKCASPTATLAGKNMSRWNNEREKKKSNSIHGHMSVENNKSINFENKFMPRHKVPPDNE